MTDITHFQVTKWLDHVRYPYATEGKNISRGKGWIGAECPFCISPDPGTHLGINTRSKRIKCWRCGVSGTVVKLVMKIQRITYNEASEVIESFSARVSLPFPKTVEKKSFEFPMGTKDGLLKHHREYLEDRGFDPDLVVKKFGVKSIGPVSNPKMLANRLLIPYIYRNQIVSYTARDITDDERTRYITCPEDRAIINVDQILYNADGVRDIVVVVEGPTDVWRMGDGFVAMGGLVWNSQRLFTLKDCKQVFIWPDGENQAQIFWKMLAYSLSSFVPDVRFVEISEGDPGQLDSETVRNFRREIFGRKY